MLNHYITHDERVVCLANIYVKVAFNVAVETLNVRTWWLTEQH